MVCAGNAACSIKKTVKTGVSPKILNAQTATFEELLGILRGYDNINSLSSNDLRITLTTGKRESGEAQVYRSSPGYILLRRPDSLRLVVQLPVTKTAVLDLLSAGDDFSAWIPRENKFFTGINSAKVLVAEDLPDAPDLTIRATHIFEAILPRSIALDAEGIRIAPEEAGDAEAKYYVLSVYRESAGPLMLPVRKVWIERSRLTVSRQQVYGDEGRMVSDITYAQGPPVDGFALPVKIRMDRPLDGYTLDLEFKTWRVNPDLPDKAFVLEPPPGAQIVPLKEKERSAAS